jgi:hypothetical protein
MFISQRIIEDALKALESVHPFYGVTFLVCKKGELPVGRMIPFPINHEEDEFLKEYYRPESRSACFYRAFRVSDKRKYWLQPDYASSGSQAIRTQTFGLAFLHDRGSDHWGWVQDYVEVLQNPQYLSEKLSAFAFASWLFRGRDWPKGTEAVDVLNAFLTEFHIDSFEQDKLFNLAIPSIAFDNGLWAEQSYSWLNVSERLGIPAPPGVPEDEGGTLSALAIQAVGPAKKLHLEFADRINLITGDNGLGKSFILDCAWWALSGIWSAFPAYPREDADRAEPTISFEIQGGTGQREKGESIYNWDTQEWSFTKARPAIPGLLIYARVDGAFAIWDPARDYWSTSDKRQAPTPLIFSREEVWNGLQETSGGKTTFLSNGLIADWIHWQNSPDKQPFETLKHVLRRLSPPDLQHGDLGPLSTGKPTRIPRDSRWMPTITHSYGDVPIVHTSAGVKRIIALAYLIVWAWEEHKTQSKLIRKEPQRNMVIVVDEIEAHLHPKWQRVILPALLDVRQDLDPGLRAQLLIATHSPLVTASIEPYFDNAHDRIFHLDFVRRTLFEGEVEVQEHDFVKWGTVDSWLKSDVFELRQARSVLGEQAIEDAKALQEKESISQDQVAEVSQRLVKYLPAHDSFWPRWTFFAAQHGVEI